MLPATRRHFLQLASGVLSAPFASAVAAQIPADAARAKIFLVFAGIAPSVDDTDLRPETNEEIMAQLRSECPGVDFTVRDTTAGANMEEVVNESKGLKSQGYDGVIIYSWPRDYELLRTGLPTINVAIINDFMNNPFPLHAKNRVIEAFHDPWRFCSDPAVSKRMFRDWVDKIHLIRALKRLKTEHILTVTDSEWVNVTYGDHRKFMPEDYNERILSAIDETFGTRVTKIGTKEVAGDKRIAELWRGESKEANEIARRWIRDAEKMINTIESEVVRSAKVYLAMKILMEKHEATAMAFHIRSLIENPRPQDLAYPALATSEFQLHNIVAKCQSHLNIILSEMILQYAYGCPSMLGDFAVDPYNSTSFVQHCEGPWNPWGDERRAPYILTDHRERRVRARATDGVGAASWILYPADEPVTLWQIDVQSKKLFVHTGKTLPMLTDAAKYRDHLYEMM